ncbi:type II toxin-antitoxin system PemK/MazF family toxin [Knoellia locipacati]|uniref:type II toxin-antitoxin system PemK/MazF family toxin n=1 Tax=Knoellia locipacati TaxID=882824 RepID=UPI00384C7A21
MLSRSAAIAGLGRALVAPCTTTVRGLPSEVTLEPGTDPVPRECVANLDSVESVSVSMLVDRLGRLSDHRLHEMCRALGIAVDCA